jgi:hypothetical protein
MDLLFIDLNPFDQGTNDFPACLKISLYNRRTLSAQFMRVPHELTFATVHAIVFVQRRRRVPLMKSRPLALLLAPFRAAFTKPTWQKVVLLVEGTLLTYRRRTVTAALRAVGLQEERHFNLFHHVLSRARWSPLQLSHLLLVLLVWTFVPSGGPVEIVVDETLEQRWGPHITKCGYYHDPVRSSQKHLRISRGFCVAFSDAHRDASVDEPVLGPAFSQRQVSLRGGG